MFFSKIIDCGCNCFWLLVPVLVFNLLFASQLPPAFQRGVFWKKIPAAISLPENILRVAVMLLPLFMRFQVSTHNQKLGVGLYLTGMLIYFASWAILIAAPQCAWSTSAIGFLAPAFTPIVWLVGISLIGNELLFPIVAYKPWMYWILSALFLMFHNLHANLVYSRSM